MIQQLTDIAAQMTGTIAYLAADWMNIRNMFTLNSCSEFLGLNKQE
jgi:hypothetical protein